MAQQQRRQLLQSQTPTPTPTPTQNTPKQLLKNKKYKKHKKCVQISQFGFLMLPFFLIVLSCWVILFLKMKNHKEISIYLALFSFIIVIMWPIINIYSTSNKNKNYDSLWFKTTIIFGFIGSILTILSILLFSTIILESTSRKEFILQSTFLGLFLLVYIASFIKNISDARNNRPLIDKYQVTFIILEIGFLIALLIVHYYTMNHVTNHTHKSTTLSFIFELIASTLTIILAIGLFIRFLEPQFINKLYKFTFRSVNDWIKLGYMIFIFTCIALIIWELYQKHDMLPIILISLLLFCMMFNVHYLLGLFGEDDDIHTHLLPPYYYLCGKNE